MNSNIFKVVSLLGTVIGLWKIYDGSIGQVINLIFSHNNGFYYDLIKVAIIVTLAYFVKKFITDKI